MIPRPPSGDAPDPRLHKSNAIVRKTAGLSSAHTLPLLAYTVVALLLIPLGYLLLSLMAAGTSDTWLHLIDTVLPRYVLNSVVLAICVAAGVALVGTACAWWVATYEFPGRRWLEWMLVLPMAMPAYVMAYAYTDLLQFSGPLQSTLRELTGWRARDYWFPEIRSLWGAAMLFTLVLFPYVYLPVRAVFLERSPNLERAARLAGMTPYRAFLHGVLPMARPALVAGVALCVMETLADYGTVSYFAVETLTTGVFKAWFNLQDRTAASQLACLLVVFVAGLLWIEQSSRRRARFTGGAIDSVRRRTIARPRAWALSLACALPAILGFVLPALVLARLGWEEWHSIDLSRVLSQTSNSLRVAGLATLLCLILALLLAFAARLYPSRVLISVVRLAGYGYALPGVVLAVAILVPLTRVDHALAELLTSHLNLDWGLLFTGSLAALSIAYVIRFLGIALGNVEAGLARITVSMEMAARGIGLSTFDMLRRVHLPLLRRGLGIALVLVFVDVLKELPATLLLRPFDFDTLATAAHNFAKDERLGAAAIPSLGIVLAGLLPVVILLRAPHRTND